MKKGKYLSILSLFLISPILLGTSRYSEIDYEYTQLEVSVIEEKEDPEREDTNLYDVKIKNIGEGYIINFKYDEGDRRKTTLYIENSLPVYGNYLIKPGGEYILKDFRWYKESGVNPECFSAGAYVRYVFSINPSSINIIEDEMADIYLIDCEIPELDDDYGYNFAITMIYDSVEYCFAKQLNSDDTLTFKSRIDDFDVAKANITKIDVFNYEIYRTNYAGYALGGLLYILLVYMLPIFSIILLLVIVSLVIKAIRKRKAKKQE